MATHIKERPASSIEREEQDKHRSKSEDRHIERSLDEALEESFPASDPVSAVQPHRHSGKS